MSTLALWNDAAAADSTSPAQPVFPADWPKPGPIDLAVHDLPHRSSAIEWWYVNTHFETAGGRRLSLFAAFFRMLKGQDATTRSPRYAHSLTWALTDADRRVYHAESRVDPSAPEMGLERIKNGRGSRDPRLNRAISEILERGRVPTPDRTFEAPIFVNERRLELDFGGARYTKLADGRYRLELASDRLGVGADLTFTLRKAPARHGDDGVVRGAAGEQMFYYFVPRCDVAGAVTLDGLAQPIVKGQGWYDHEFGGQLESGAVPPVQATPASGPPPAAPERVDIAWNWASVQLDDGRDVSAYALVRVADNRILHQWAVVSDATGAWRAYKTMTLEPLATWRSKRTFYDYPTRWRLRVPEAAIDLSIDAAFEDQELMTTISKPAFWEGRTEVRGTWDRRAVSGVGYIERSGFEPVRDLDEFFAAVGEEVRRSVAEVLPERLTAQHAAELFAAPGREHYLDGVDLEQLSRTLIAPIRCIADRGGKSWRSYAALAAIDAVGGDSRKFVQWLAVPELMHVGSLIVDDVQDRSDVRRGGPTAHQLFGDPLAINAGTACYFVCQRLLVNVDLSAAAKLRIYDLYFEVMRGGHAGQALDIDGLAAAVADCVRSGESDLLEKRVLATHRLKAGVPAGSLARMGAVAGGGSDAQVNGVGQFFETLGLAFQIIDDVLNVRGFKGNLKARGEDVANGTITLPVAKAMGRLPAQERRWLAEALATKPKDREVVETIIAQLESTGAVQACAEQARHLVESAWCAVEPLLADSIPKVMLRAFGWYLLDRHY
ncbi:MAG TPA: polyprenyl synthetase family protein [Polyangia bacterium]|nr:polyprenyl synthetase family protein [Polyangia bacterium]